MTSGSRTGIEFSIFSNSKNIILPPGINGKMAGRNTILDNISRHLPGMHKRYSWPFLLLTLAFYSCSDKYLPLKSQYGFKSNTGLADYGLLDYWAAHPWKKDPSDSISKALSGETRDSIADVFFIYPTSFTQKASPGKLNAEIDDSYLNAKTDYSSILYQATV